MSLKLVSGAPLINSMTPAELQAEVIRLRKEVEQCATELEEASKLLAPHYPRVAGIYEEATGRARTAIGLPLFGAPDR